MAAVLLIPPSDVQPKDTNPAIGPSDRSEVERKLRHVRALIDLSFATLPTMPSFVGFDHDTQWLLRVSI
jgi:hypothetical protein